MNKRIDKADSDAEKYYDLEGERITMFKDYSKASIIFEIKRFLYFLDLINKNISSKRKNIKILDLGCGDGQFLEMLQKKGFNNLYGLDISLTRVKRARQLTGLDAKRIKKGFAEKTPFQSGFFDIIICSEVIEHVKNPEEIVSEIHRLLKKGGFFILATPIEEKLSYHRCVHCLEITPSSGHLHSFKLVDLKEMLSKAGLKYFKHFYLICNVNPFFFLNGLVGVMPFSIFKVLNDQALAKAKRYWVIITGRKN